MTQPNEKRVEKLAKEVYLSEMSEIPEVHPDTHKVKTSWEAQLEIVKNRYRKLGCHVLKLIEEAVAQERETLASSLEQEADLYEKDGAAGPKGLNCWGWRDIAKFYRVKAVTIRNRSTSQGKGDAQ